MDSGGFENKRCDRTRTGAGIVLVEGRNATVLRVIRFAHGKTGAGGSIPRLVLCMPRIRGRECVAVTCGLTRGLRVRQNPHAWTSAAVIKGDRVRLGRQCGHEGRRTIGSSI
jgi:hypothetical protein